MKILTAKEIKRAEELAFERYYTEAELMKRAGHECTLKIIKYYGEAIKGEAVSVICGNGKNAGDGFVIAKNLSDKGYGIRSCRQKARNSRAAYVF